MNQQAQVSEKDVFELTRGELNSVIAYLGKKPAEETFGLLSLLLGRGPTRLVPVEVASPVSEATLLETAAVSAENNEESKTTEQ